uniref:hypothetical protein n=1 Tax=Treponema endosymbiont of Eucomonympha sp. TaxID=1580831 RepID=UPI000B324D0E
MKNPRRDALDFVALDFETAQYARESAIAVGLVRFSGGREAEIDSDAKKSADIDGRAAAVRLRAVQERQQEDS